MTSRLARGVLAPEPPALVSGGYTPVAATRDVYVQSEWKFDGSISATHGNDANTGLSSSVPLRTLQRALQLYGNNAEGMTTVIHLMGAGGSDPVDKPTEGRIYLTRGLNLGAGEAWRNNICFRGPRQMLPASADLTFVTAHDNGLRCSLEFSIAVPNADGLFFCTVMADGRELTFPYPIQGTVSSSQPEVLGPPTGYALGTASLFWYNNIHPVVGTIRCYIGQPAAWLAPDGGDVAFNSVLVTGQGSYRAGDRVGTVSNTFDPSLPRTFERLRFSRLVVDVAGHVDFDCCLFDDHAYFRGGSVRFGNCSAAQLVEFQAEGRYIEQESQLTSPSLATVGRMLAYVLPIDSNSGAAGMDPLWPVSGVDLVVCQSGALRIGHSLGGRPGHFRFTHGLAVIGNPGTAAVEVYGPSSLMQMPGAMLAISSAGGLGIWAKDGGRVRLNDAGGYVQIDGATAGALKVGNGAAIALGAGGGAFRDAATWRGNFCRRLAATSGYPDDDDSRIWDAGWEPGNYWNGY